MKSVAIAALWALSLSTPLLADDKVLTAVEGSLRDHKVPEDLAARVRQVAKEEVGDGVQLDADKASHAKSATDTYTLLLFGPDTRLNSPDRKDIAVEMFRWGLRRFKAEATITEKQREETARRWNTATGFAMPRVREIYSELPDGPRTAILEKIEVKLKRTPQDFGRYTGFADLWTGDEPTAERVSSMVAKGTPLRDFAQAEADQCKQQLSTCPPQLRKTVEPQLIDMCAEGFVARYTGEINRAYVNKGMGAPAVVQPPEDLLKRYAEYADAAAKERQAEFDAKAKADRDRFKNAVDKAAKQATGVTTPGGVPKPPKPPEEER